MAKQKKEYEALLQQVTDTLKNSPEQLTHLAEEIAKYREAASDMTKDELALIESYLKRDLSEFAHNVQESPSSFAQSPFYRVLSETIWESLAEVADQTQLEWQVLMDDFQHKGIYEVGELIGLGQLACEKCGHSERYTHVKTIEPCSVCGHTRFIRKPLEP